MPQTGSVGLIAAVSESLAIARNGTTPWHYPADLARFKRITTGTTVVMGRGTFEAVDAVPLADRTNFVITRRNYDHVRTFRTVADALAAARGPVWIIGGARVYADALAFAKRIDLTYVPDQVEDGDLTFFPRFDESDWIAGPRRRLAEDPRLSIQSFERRGA